MRIFEFIQRIVAIETADIIYLARRNYDCVAVLESTQVYQ